MQRQQERGGDGLNPRRDCSNFIKPQNWALKEVCGSLPSRQEESPDRRSSVVTRPLASLTSGQALDQQRLGQRLSVGCSGDTGAQTEGGAAPRMRTLKAKRELSVRRSGLPWALRFHRELLLPPRLDEERARCGVTCL